MLGIIRFSIIESETPLGGSKRGATRVKPLLRAAALLGSFLCLELHLFGVLILVY